MAEIPQSGSDTDDVSPYMGSESYNLFAKVFNIIVSMIVTQISHGLDDRSHIVQAHDERRIGAVWNMAN
ncbi:unnamed protein product [Rotaria sp. Silwood1]|nr:unnamed protein product [Rotaria sp. Silwood1]CAF1078442.1 unnamed protein product [Rotaria sp. Silwood1]CAF3409921.1 unnamed protein product [Rotaria sp. Silwood1]CAF3436731.1 unnamed protein product [Rotaria sp. Silwood1]CAF3988921.1 unnamed protein product [Rotaria sp. Silwood1]